MFHFSRCEYRKKIAPFSRCTRTANANDPEKLCPTCRRNVNQQIKQGYATPHKYWNCYRSTLKAIGKTPKIQLIDSDDDEVDIITPAKKQNNDDNDDGNMDINI